MATAYIGFVVLGVGLRVLGKPESGTHLQTPDVTPTSETQSLPCSTPSQHRQPTKKPTKKRRVWDPKTLKLMPVPRLKLKQDLPKHSHLYHFNKF